VRGSATGGTPHNPALDTNLVLLKCLTDESLAAAEADKVVVKDMLETTVSMLEQFGAGKRGLYAELNQQKEELMRVMAALGEEIRKRECF